jgi:NAD(P)H-hydrate epimerase
MNQVKNLTETNISKYLHQLNLPQSDSHKGDNGKLLIIGGSNLFHAASRWSLDIASRFVDMVFYSSVPLNNQLITEAKEHFWNGIVIPRTEIEDYIQEADCILIGPGMDRVTKQKNKTQMSTPTKSEWQNDTKKIVDYLLANYPNKKWVIDAGALQMLDPHLLNAHCLITPHEKELTRLLKKISAQSLLANKNYNQIVAKLNKSTVLLKGPVDTIMTPKQIFQISGGNAGMTKGGTGDVLAGLAAGLYTNNQILPSTIVASHINKKTGDYLYKEIGPFYNATNLRQAIPTVLWSSLR